MTEMHQIEQLFRAKNLWQKRGGTQSLLTSLGRGSTLQSSIQNGFPSFILYRLQILTCQDLYRKE